MNIITKRAKFIGYSASLIYCIIGGYLSQHNLNTGAGVMFVLAVLFSFMAYTVDVAKDGE